MTENHQTIELVPSGPNLPDGIRFIRGVYWFFVVGGFLSVGALVTGLTSTEKASLAETSFGLMTNTLILYGLMKRKYWLVSLILFYSSLLLITNFLHVTGETAINSSMIAKKIGSFLLALFSIYQVCIFMRKDTKLFFNEKGQTLY
jgi:hypothetical protein